MAAIVVTKVTVGRGPGEDVLRDVELHLEAGRYGLTGPNGAGKTTLLELLAGELAPATGSVARVPRDTTHHLVRAGSEVALDDVEPFAWETGKLARRLRSELDLDPGALERWASLSPGERRRWQIGAAIAAECDVLLLDEPEAHLDARSRERLASALERYDGLLVLASHDRALLDRVTGATLRVSGGHVTRHPGAFSAAREAWLRAEAARAKDRALAVQRRDEAERHLHDARRRSASAEGLRSTGRRMRCPEDSDARGGLAQFRADTASARLAQVVRTARSDLERRERGVTPFEVDKSLGRSVFARYEPAPKPRLVELVTAELRAGDGGGALEGGPDDASGQGGGAGARGRVLARGVRVSLGRGDRVWVRGPNGAGKSTLVRTLVRGWALPRERLVELAQAPTPELAMDMLDALRKLPTEGRARVLSVVAALGVDPARLLASRRPSSGEAQKLALALGLARSAWALALDEPENHLDAPSLERLEQALAEYPGALLLVTHDAALAARLTTIAWTLSDGRVEIQPVASASSGALARTAAGADAEASRLRAGPTRK